eukprot:Gb_39415 [translate_table: standard]
MGFVGSIRNDQLLKRKRVRDEAPVKDHLCYCNCPLDEGHKSAILYHHKRRCINITMLGAGVGFQERYEGATDEDGEATTDLFTCQSHLNEALREEIADSEVCSSEAYYDFSPPFGRNLTHQGKSVPLPDDAQSSTTDTDTDSEFDTSDEDYSSEDESEGESSPEGNYISYLLEASDDDLGLPPLCSDDNIALEIQHNFLQENVGNLDLDLDLDLPEHFFEWDGKFSV